MQALGASRARALWEVAMEARLPLIAAGMAAFGALISEVGAAMMVGGNIAGETRVLTTAAVLEASRGEFALALALGLILLAVAFAVNLALTTLQQQGGRLSGARLELEGVVVEADGARILDVAALELAANRTTAVLGANGAGKSTLLRVAAGLRAASAGTRAA